MSKLEIKSERILQRFDNIAESNMANYIRTSNDGTTTVDLRGKSKDELYGIQELTTETYLVGKGDNKHPVTVVKVKLADRFKANEALARYRRLFNEQPQVQVNIALANMSDAALEARLRELERSDEPPLLTQGREKGDEL